MKTFLLTILASLFMVLNVKADDAKLTFDKVMVSVPCKIHCMQADTSEVRIRKNGENVKYEIKNNILYIKPVKYISPDDVNAYDDENSPVIYIYTEKMVDITPTNSLHIIERKTTNTAKAKGNENTATI